MSSSLLDILTSQVQDRVNNETGVLSQPPVGLYSGKLREAQVWGIDCYTRRMLEIAVEDRVCDYGLWIMLRAMAIPLLCCCHIPHRVVHWRSIADLLLSHPTISLA